MAITGLRFSPTDPNLVYSCGADSTVVVWDLRTASPATHFAVPDDMVRTTRGRDASGSARAHTQSERAIWVSCVVCVCVCDK